jgi:CRISPR-associated exonuclease Cas4
MSKYAEDNLLMLSGIQHIAFCERQWAFIHIEQQWIENNLTLEGRHLHERVDNPALSGKNKTVVELRSLPIVSYSLGLYGIADMIELQPTDNSKNSILHPKHNGFWQPIPVEYKRGKPKPDERDEVQLCAQAICLEEMYNIYISQGYLYYGETRHRSEVVFIESLRDKVKKYAERMHYLFDKNETPKPIYATHCKSCSLYNICLPQSFEKQVNVSEYIKNHIAEDI